jgi:hypothetical protein
MDVKMDRYAEKLESGYTEQIISSYLEEMIKNPKLYQRFNDSDDRYSDSDLGDEYETLQHYVSSRLPLGLTEEQETDWWASQKWIMDDIQK